MIRIANERHHKLKTPYPAPDGQGVFYAFPTLSVYISLYTES